MFKNFYDTITTILGFVIAAIVATQIDYIKLVHGDNPEIAKVIGAVLIGFQGYFTNKAKTAAKLLIILLLISSFSAPVQAQVVVAYQPENMAVLKALNVSTMGLWNIRACNEGASTVAIPPERFYMAALDVHWIEPVRAQAVITDSRQNSIKGKILTYVTYGGIAATGLTGFGAVAASAKTVAAIASGTLLANKFKEQVQSELPVLGPYLDKLLTSPLVLAPGGCDTRQAFAGKMKGAHPLKVTINLPTAATADPTATPKPSGVVSEAPAKPAALVEPLPQPVPSEAHPAAATPFQRTPSIA